MRLLDRLWLALGSGLLAALVLKFVLGFSLTLVLIGSVLFVILIDLIAQAWRDRSRGAGPTVPPPPVEKMIEDLLAQLDPAEFQVFSNLVHPTGTVDHIVLTRSGAVVVIEAKSPPENILDSPTSGEAWERDFIRRTQDNILWLGARLEQYAQQKVWVNGVICFTQGMAEVRQPMKGVRAAYPEDLLKVIQSSRTIPPLADWLWANFRTILQAEAP
jgi:hypothetical protein